MKTSGFLIFVGIAASCLLWSSQLLDQTLLPRFMALGLTLAAVLLSEILSRKEKETKPSLTQLLFLTFAVLNVLSCCWAVNKSEAVFESGKTGLGFILFLIMSSRLTNKKFASAFFKLLVCISISGNMLAMVQYFELPNFNYNNAYHITSISGHKNLFSSLNFLLSGLIIAGLYKFLEGTWSKVAALNLLVSLLMVVVLQTRAVWMGALAAVLIGLALCVYKKGLLNSPSRTPILGALAGMMFLGICSYLVLKQNAGLFAERVNILKFHSSEAGNERLVLWKKTFALVKIYPLFGVGAGNWQIMYPSVSLNGLPNVEFKNVTFQRPHNDFLWILSETGIGGLGLYLLFIVAITLNGIASLRAADSKNESLYRIALLCCFAGYLSISFFDFPRERIEHIILFTSLISLICTNERDSKCSFTLSRHHTFWMKGILGICCVAAVIVGIARYEGESAMKRLYVHKATQHWPAVIRDAKKASSFFYSIDPTSVPVSWYSGLAYYAIGEAGQAEIQFGKAYVLAPYNHYVINNLASCIEARGDHKKASGLYLEAIKISPHYDDALLNLSAIYYNNNQPEEALKYVICASDSPRKTQYMKAILQKTLHKNR